MNHMVCWVLMGLGGGGFCVDVCNGFYEKLIVSGQDELLLNELNELDRSTGVVFFV